MTLNLAQANRNAISNKMFTGTSYKATLVITVSSEMVTEMELFYILADDLDLCHGRLKCYCM